jgi:ectoine hydroxylase-related dioxygenase (phytanoyl-CoA dioxygenase family)
MAGAHKMNERAKLKMQSPVLTFDQIDSFCNTGYLVAPNAFSADAMASIERWAREVEAMPEESGKHWIYWEESQTNPGKKIVCRIEKIKDYHAGFADLTEILKGPVDQLLGEQSQLFKEKINFKKPGGDGFKPHQDSQAGWDTYADLFISVLVCIDEATIENGCLQIVGGEHSKGLYDPWEPIPDEEMAKMDVIPVPTKPGDVIFFDSFAPHSSEPNHTDKTRRIYFATYNKACAGDHHEAYYQDKHKSYPPDIDRLADKKYVFRV